MNPQVFREYDIRGIVEQDFDASFVTDLGRAYLRAPSSRQKSITLGRIAGSAVPASVCEGLIDSGIDVTDVG